MRDRASDLRAIADGRLMLNVRNGVTVSRSMLARIADEFEAMSTALAAKDAELAGAVQEIERLKNLVGDPEGTAAHAEAFLARAERAEARVAELEKALEEVAHLWRHGIADTRAELSTSFDYSLGLNDALFRVRQIARRALTGGKEDG